MCKLKDHKYQIVNCEGETYLVPYSEFITLASLINENDYNSAKCLLLISDNVIKVSDCTFITVQGDIYYEG